MTQETQEPLTFVEMVLVLLEDRFPWLGSEEQDVSGADTVEELSNLHETLIQRRKRTQVS
jgi:hypothetical protein